MKKFFFNIILLFHECAQIQQQSTPAWLCAPQLPPRRSAYSQRTARSIVRRFKSWSTFFLPASCYAWINTTVAGLPSGTWCQAGRPKGVLVDRNYFTASNFIYCRLEVISTVELTANHRCEVTDRVPGAVIPQQHDQTFRGIRDVNSNSGMLAEFLIHEAWILKIINQ